MNIRERPPLRVADEIITPGGNRYRWAPDEASPANMPSRRRDSSTMPGGYENADGTLARKPGVDYSDLERLSTHRRYGAGGETVYEGRLERAPRVSGNEFSISPSSVGWQAHLDDDQSVRLLGRDIDMSSWTGPSVQRRLNLITTSGRRVEADPAVRPDDATSAPTLVHTIQGPWTSGANPISEALYNPGVGVNIGSLYYAWKRLSNVSNTDGNWTWGANLGTDDTFGSSDTTGNLRAAGPGTGTLTATTTRRCANVQIGYTTGAGTDDTFELGWTNLIVYGDHGLTNRGTEPDGGFYDADLIAYALTRWCPLLKYTSESVTADTFVIPQFVYLDPTTVSELVRGATRFNLRDWAVWDDRTFWLHDRGARGRQWRARVGPAQLEETGPQVDRVWNSIMVAYQDVDGSTRTAGPVGSGADTEDDALTDTDPENPANKLGIIRRDMLTMGTSTAAGAVEVGRRFLEETRVLDSSGQATFTGYVEDDRGVVHPYWAPKAGDTVVFVDAADISPRRIVRADNDHDAYTCTVDLDSPPDGLQALLERLQVALVVLGI